MSQQEFMPQSQSFEQENDGEEIYRPQYPYSWSGKLDKEAAPRDEPPFVGAQSNVPNEKMGQIGQVAGAKHYDRGYTAQQGRGFQAAGRFNAFTPDGDAYEQGYGPYKQYSASQGVPRWARPQKHKRGPLRLALLIVLVLAFLHPILTVAGFAIMGIGVLLASAVLLVVLIPFALLAMSILMGILRLAFWPARGRGWYGRWYSGRGPLWF